MTWLVKACSSSIATTDTRCVHVCVSVSVCQCQCLCVCVLVISLQASTLELVSITLSSVSSQARFSLVSRQARFSLKLSSSALEHTNGLRVALLTYCMRQHL